MDVEKEESILKKEVKICMPYYKIAYSIAFVVILSAIQPVVYANEIGQAVERAVSLLAVRFLCRYLSGGSAEQTLGSILPL